MKTPDSALIPPAPPLSADEAALLSAWLHGRSPHTQRAYRANIARFRAYIEKPLAALTLADVQRYADHLAAAGLAAASRARMLAAVKSLLTFAHETGYTPFNVGHGMRLPAVRARLSERIPTEEDVLRMLGAEPNPRNHALLRVLYNAGLRISEACSLQWRDLTPRGASGQLSVWGKGDKERALLLSSGTWAELMALRPTTVTAEQPVFQARGGSALSAVQAWRVVKAAARRVGLSEKLSPHWLRHAHASHALDRGAPVSLVRDGLGHASLATTSRYTHARPDDSSSRYLPL